MPDPKNHPGLYVVEDYLLDSTLNGALDSADFASDLIMTEFCEHDTIDLIRTIWGWSRPYKLLDCGSASGQTLEAFARVGVETWGFENSQHIHARTPAQWRDRNLLGEVRNLPSPTTPSILSTTPVYAIFQKNT